jgi:hypothetical protein
MRYRAQKRLFNIVDYLVRRRGAGGKTHNTKPRNISRKVPRTFRQPRGLSLSLGYGKKPPRVGRFSAASNKNRVNPPAQVPQGSLTVPGCAADRIDYLYIGEETPDTLSDEPVFVRGNRGLPKKRRHGPRIFTKDPPGLLLGLLFVGHNDTVRGKTLDADKLGMPSFPGKKHPPPSQGQGTSHLLTPLYPRTGGIHQHRRAPQQRILKGGTYAVGPDDHHRIPQILRKPRLIKRLHPSLLHIFLYLGIVDEGPHRVYPAVRNTGVFRLRQGHVYRPADTHAVAQYIGPD